MIDDLLARFGPLGVRTATPRPPEPDARPQLSTQELKARGWSATMIRKLLPRHDGQRANYKEVGGMRKRLTAPVKLYDLARVEEAETTEDFLLAQAAADKAREAGRKGSAARAAREQQYLDGYVPRFADPPDPLRGFLLWRHHLRQLDQYQDDHQELIRGLGRSNRQLLNSHLYDKHRAAFRERFGEKY